jgi:mRNA-degrading endonuclease RelE of RelBE toxin-antitoxin system
VRFIFFETPLFTRVLPEYLDDDAYRALQNALLQQPKQGRVVPGTGGFRKLRWRDRRRGKGKRSGLRVIYYVLSSERQIWFFTIYDKDEAENLTAGQCRLLQDAIHEELRARRGNA